MQQGPVFRTSLRMGIQKYFHCRCFMQRYSSLGSTESSSSVKDGIDLNSGMTDLQETEGFKDWISRYILSYLSGSQFKDSSITDSTYALRDFPSSLAFAFILDNSSGLNLNAV